MTPPPELTLLIEFKNVSKHYDSHAAVIGLNLSIIKASFSCWWAAPAAANPLSCA